jgi:hypothetical protein
LALLRYGRPRQLLERIHAARNDGFVGIWIHLANSGTEAARIRDRVK